MVEARDYKFLFSYKWVDAPARFQQKKFKKLESGFFQTNFLLLEDEYVVTNVPKNTSKK